MGPLTSPRNPRVKLARRLHARRHRAALGLVLVEGPRVLAAALDAGAELHDVFCTESFCGRSPTLAARLDDAAPTWLVPPDVMAALAATERPQGVAAVAAMPRQAERPPVTPDLLVLALDAVADPGNVGVAIRAAHAAGAAAVVLGPRCCDRFNPKAVRASAGGVFAVPTLAVGDVVGVLAAFRAEGARVVAAEPRGARLCWSVPLTGPTVLVVGGETRGLSEAVSAAADQRVAIPMPGGAESLNAGVAAGVLLYEAVRQRAAAPRGAGR